MNIEYDVVVVGAGHAGCEAALAAARMGASTALITLHFGEAASMPCNPSVGGIAKSHLVVELDAMGGEIARNTDYTGIQFRILNTRKGPAVQATRVQCDKQAYSLRMQAVLRAQPRLVVVESEVSDLLIHDGRLKGIQTASGNEIRAKTVVITAGTFLNGTIHIGDCQRPGGRDNAPAAIALSGALKRLGLTLERLKTGTPPRLAADSIDYTRMAIQDGIEPVPFMSQRLRRHAAINERFHVEHDSTRRPMFHVEHRPSCLSPWPPGTHQLPCYITHTTERTHEIVQTNLTRSSLYGGQISGTGVRYCPSIEDKIVKFASKRAHHVFIEPEGRNTDLIYPNGISNSLPEEVQCEMVRSIPGLENARIIRWGYAIEYDFVDPTQLSHALESKQIENLFLGGQINGTTGYEEAAALGFMAGVNAVRKARREAPFVLGRDEAYIGVLVDDLVTKGTDEPYRMFTSRAEHRILLRQDTAHFRLLEHARALGIVSAERLRETGEDAVRLQNEIARLDSLRQEGLTMTQILRQPGVRYVDLAAADPNLPQDLIQQVETAVKYAGYIVREQRHATKMRDVEQRLIPSDFDFWSIKALRYECREKLSHIRPDNLGQASRIPGVNPADISVLSIAIKRQQRQGAC